MLGLLTSRRFLPLFACQSLSAFGDNLLKNAVVFLILFRQAGSGSAVSVTLAGAAFVAPFFLLSGLAGQIADRFDKALVARRVKAAEMLAAVVAAAGLALQSVPVLLAALAAYGAASALFGPVKYGILPDHLRTDELPAANALVEAATFVAILAGTIAGGVASTDGVHPTVLPAATIALAAASWAASRRIPAAGGGDPDLRIDRNVLRSAVSLVVDLRGDARLLVAAVAVSWFWLVGAVLLSLLPTLATEVLGGGATTVTFLLATFAVGVAAGSGLASWIAGGRIVMLPVPLGAFAIAGFSIDLALAPGTPGRGLDVAAFLAAPGGLRAALDLAGIAAAGGLLAVPAFAAVQAWTAPGRRARTVAAVNVLSAAFMTVGSLAVAALQWAGVGTPALVGGLGAASMAMGALVLARLPTDPLVDLLVVVFRILFRTEVRGRENLAKAGDHPVVVLNHVSFLDAALALSLLDRQPTFAIDSGIARRPWVRPFLRLTRALPIDPTKPMATRSLIAAVRSGETLAIFPEGRITVTGSMMKVYDGAALVADRSGSPIVPVRIEGLERTFASRLGPRQVRRSLFPKVVVTVLEPVAMSVPAEIKGRARRKAAGAELNTIMSDAAFRTGLRDRTVFEAVAEAARVHGMSRVAAEDPVAGPTTYGRLLAGAAVLGRKLAALAPAGGSVGVLLPTSTGASATLLALMSAGRVPAMINFTAGPAAAEDACRTACVEAVVTSRAFVDKARLEPFVAALAATRRIVYLEDVRASVTRLDRLRGLLTRRRAIVRRKADDPVAVLFTSGSEGSPKAVVLSNRNLLANVAQVAARIDFGRTDKVFSVLPVFHSFGLTDGLILPLVSGVPVYLYPSPLHYRIVPELVYASNATVMFGTDTFLAGYARSADPYDFRSIRYAVSGAEPVKESTRRTWQEKFGIRILEGYGVTETSPVLALNTPTFNRSGTVGRIMPGMEARLEPVPGIEEGGRLHVRGPNVMLGYMLSSAPGVLVPPKDGWHDTGDVVTIDADGFVAIRGRARRFAKIGGEMVSLAAVEALAAELWPDDPSVAVAVPDPRKGERIVLLTQRGDADRASFLTFAKGRGASDVSLPAEVRAVDRVPLLGSGKVDFAGAAKLLDPPAAAA